MQLFSGVEKAELSGAVALVLSTWRYCRIPPPAIVLEALTRLRRRGAEVAAESVGCPKCDGLGLVYGPRVEADKEPVSMWLCSCDLGEGKRIFLTEGGQNENAKNDRHQWEP